MNIYYEYKSNIPHKVIYFRRNKYFKTLASDYNADHTNQRALAEHDIKIKLK